MKNLTIQGAIEYLKKQGVDVDTSKKLVIMPPKPVGIHTWGVVDFLTAKTRDRNHGFIVMMNGAKIAPDLSPIIPAAIEDY